MPAIETAQLATLTNLSTFGPPAAAFQDMSSDTKNAHLRRASGIVLSSYKKRYGLPLTQWGDFTIGLVVAIASYTLIATRGFRDTQTDKAIREAYTDAMQILQEIADLTNDNPREDPDIVDSTPDTEEAGPLLESAASPFEWAGGSSSTSTCCTSEWDW